MEPNPDIIKAVLTFPKPKKVKDIEFFSWSLQLLPEIYQGFLKDC